MKKLLTFAMSFVLIFSALGGCAKPAADNPSENSLAFISAVTEVSADITLASEQKINSAILIYNSLSQDEQKFESVKKAKYQIDVYKSLYDLLKTDADERAYIAAESARVKNFIEKVNSLPTVGSLELLHKDLVLSAQTDYEALSEESVSLASVVSAYGRLVAASDKIKALELAEQEEIAQIELDAFMALFNALPAVSMDNAVRDAIYECSDAYDIMSDLAKEMAGEEVKTKLDKIIADYVLLKDTTEANAFIEIMKKFDSSQVSLASKKALLDAEFAYESLSDEAKLLAGVLEANQILKNIRAEYDVLDNAEEVNRIARFLQRVELVPLAEDVIIDDFFVIENARAAYDELMTVSAAREDVAAAYAKLTAAQRAFDENGFARIEAKDPNIQFSGDRPPHIILQLEGNMINSLCAFYSEYEFNNQPVSLSMLSGKVKMYLNIYESGKIGADFVGRVELVLTRDLTHIINGGIVLNAVKTVSAKNPNSAIKSGREIGFSINFEDAANKYVPSAYTKVGVNSSYTWID